MDTCIAGKGRETCGSNAASISSAVRGAPVFWLLVMLSAGCAIAAAADSPQADRGAIEIVEAPAGAPAEAGAGVPEPAPVTLAVQNMEIREVLALLSDSRPMNLVCGSEVEGRVSIDLHEVPFPEALRAVVGMAGFDVVRRGNIYFVQRDSNRDPREALLREARTFRLDYAQPDAILQALQPSLSPQGKAVAYPPLRTLVVEDRPDVLDRLAILVDALDIAPRQVLIEAQIIEARISDDLRFGIDWSLVFSAGAGSGAIDVAGFASPAEAGAQGLFVSWGEGDFTSVLESFEGIEDLRTLAAPRVLAIDGTEAEIIIGGQLGFSVLTTVDNTVIQSVEFLDTGAQLRITPTITGDGYVLMKIRPELSDGVIENGLPSKNTSQVTTQVLVKDGHTLMIGGLIREREETIRQGIPLLVRLPLLGHLFGRTTRSVQRSELITLITPRILEPGEDLTYRGTGLLGD
ncbi:MAG: secretin N-terminal domain-containing protein [Candidatus Eisenbacteria bacterium]